MLILRNKDIRTICTLHETVSNDLCDLPDDPIINLYDIVDATNIYSRIIERMANMMCSILNLSKDELIFQLIKPDDLQSHKKQIVYWSREDKISEHMTLTIPGKLYELIESAERIDFLKNKQDWDECYFAATDMVAAADYLIGNKYHEIVEGQEASPTNAPIVIVQTNLSRISVDGQAKEYPPIVLEAVSFIIEKMQDRIYFYRHDLLNHIGIRDKKKKISEFFKSYPDIGALIKPFKDSDGKHTRYTFTMFFDKRASRTE